MKKKLNMIINMTINIIKDISKNDLTGLASEMAFNFITAISPFFISVIAIFGLFSSDNIISQIIMFLNPIAPKPALQILERVLTGVNQTPPEGLLTFGFLGTIWSVTGITDVLIKGMNRSYKVNETRPIWITKSLAVFFVLITVLVLFIALNLIIFTSILLKYLSNYIIYIPNHIQIFILLSRWPIIFLALFTVILIIYAFMPSIKADNKIRILSSIPGTLFFCIFWSLASWSFSLYTDNYSRYNQVYGALGAVIILLTWLYYTSLILLIGGEINSETYKKYYKKIEE